MFKIGDKVRLKKDQPFERHKGVIFTVTNINAHFNKDSTFEVSNDKGEVVKEWFGYRLELVKSKRSHYPAWF